MPCRKPEPTVWGARASHECERARGVGSGYRSGHNCPDATVLTQLTLHRCPYTHTRINVAELFAGAETLPEISHTHGGGLTSHTVQVSDGKALQGVQCKDS